MSTCSIFNMLRRQIRRWRDSIGVDNKWSCDIERGNDYKMIEKCINLVFPTLHIQHDTTHNSCLVGVECIDTFITHTRSCDILREMTNKLLSSPFIAWVRICGVSRQHIMCERECDIHLYTPYNGVIKPGYGYTWDCGLSDKCMESRNLCCKTMCVICLLECK